MTLDWRKQDESENMDSESDAYDSGDGNRWQIAGVRCR